MREKGNETVVIDRSHYESLLQEHRELTAIQAIEPEEVLKELGSRLADLLDADHWNNIEPLLLSMAAAK